MLCMLTVSKGSYTCDSSAFQIEITLLFVGGWLWYRTKKTSRTHCWIYILLGLVWVLGPCCLAFGISTAPSEGIVPISLVASTSVQSTSAVFHNIVVDCRSQGLPGPSIICLHATSELRLQLHSWFPNTVHAWQEDRNAWSKKKAKIQEACVNASRRE